MFSEGLNVEWDSKCESGIQDEDEESCIFILCESLRMRVHSQQYLKDRPGPLPNTAETRLT